LTAAVPLSGVIVTVEEYVPAARPIVSGTTDTRAGALYTWPVIPSRVPVVPCVAGLVESQLAGEKDVLKPNRRQELVRVMV
jgi:hypothetical protein